MSFKNLFLLFNCLIFTHNLLYAQENKALHLTVLGLDNGLRVSGAEVQIGSWKGQTNDQGVFELPRLEPGKHAIYIHSTGYTDFRDTLFKNHGETLELRIQLKSNSIAIEGIVLQGQSQLEQLKKASIRSIVIDTRAISTQATSLTDIMNQSTGIRIRQNGAVGSKPEISINGFQGKAIKYFKDGIPIDYLGDGYNISALSLEMLDRVEVYKGVLPVSLGADALGGAINLVSQRKKQGLQAFYEIGSFGSHKTGLLAHGHSPKEQWEYGLEAYYTNSKNDYKALVQVVNPETKNLEPQRLPLFHNAFQHILGEAYVGIRNQSWADELKFSLTGFALQKEQQHPALMTDAYGAVLGKQRTIVPAIRYRINLLDQKLKIDQFASFNTLITSRIDTLHGKYNWYGQLTPNTSIGETRLPSQSNVHESQWLSRTNVGYRLSPTSKLELNYVFQSAERSGNDPLGPKIETSQIDVLTIPSNYQKQVLGLALTNAFLEEKLENQLIAKGYHFKASGLNNTWYSNNISDQDHRSQSGQFFGFTEAIKYQLSPSALFRASAEYSYRLPEREELFGNQIFVVPNFELKPEKSLNINLGYQQRFRDRLQVEANFFYRRTKGMILLVPIQAPNAQYQNQEHVRGYGLDLDISYRLLDGLEINANATWQDLRLFGITKTEDLWKNNARLRNTPYFFANLGAKYKKKKLISSGDELALFTHYNFMREFYLETIPKDLEPGGFLGLHGSANLNSSLIIPNQSLWSAGFNYQFSGERINLAGEIRNMLNQDVYDYYRVQRPGRSFHLKLSYRLMSK